MIELWHRTSTVCRYYVLPIEWAHVKRTGRGAPLSSTAPVEKEALSSPSSSVTVTASPPVIAAELAQSALAPCTSLGTPSEDGSTSYTVQLPFHLCPGSEGPHRVS